MSVPVYPDLKPSGPEWLGDVPTHWRLMPLKRCLEFSTGWTPPTGRDEYYGDGYFWANISDLGSRSISLTAKTITEEAVKMVRMTIAPVGSLLFSFKLSLGLVSIVDVPMFTNEAIAAFHPSKDVLTPFLFYAAPVYVPQNAAENIYGAGLLSRDRIANALLCVPPVSEQAAIASFLDGETAKIDALVAEQERLIELLKEKRQAVISHAVTKGLDPNVPMKDSGVEWLGLVPAHWRMARLKHVMSHVVDCLHTTPHYDGELEFPAIRTADVERGRLLLEQTRMVSLDVYQERIQRLKPLAGDILYTREGERFGLAATVPKDVDLCLGQKMMMFRVIPAYISKYFMWLLNSDSIFQQVLAKLGGATAPHVNIADVINFELPIPPADEQLSIGQRISRATGGLDDLIYEGAHAIELLNERRSALISAAVTGKIDVRGLVAPSKPSAVAA